MIEPPGRRDVRPTTTITGPLLGMTRSFPRTESPSNMGGVKLSRAVASIATAVAIAVAGSGTVGGCDLASRGQPSADSVEAPEPVRVLRLPDYRAGSLSESETRTVYAQGELRMRLLDEQLASQGVSTEERARIMFQERNSLRSWARTLMRNRVVADLLNALEPNLTFEDLIARNQSKGLDGDDLFTAMITSATRSRSSVNDFLGIDPATPPPLPPAKPAQPAVGDS